MITFKNPSGPQWEMRVKRRRLPTLQTVSLFPKHSCVPSLHPYFHTHKTSKVFSWCFKLKQRILDGKFWETICYSHLKLKFSNSWSTKSSTAYFLLVSESLKILIITITIDMCHEQISDWPSSSSASFTSFQLPFPCLFTYPEKYTLAWYTIHLMQYNPNFISDLTSKVTVTGQSMSSHKSATPRNCPRTTSVQQSIFKLQKW